MSARDVRRLLARSREKLAAVDAKIVQEVAQELFQPGRMGVAASGPEMNAEKLALASRCLGS